MLLLLVDAPFRRWMLPTTSRQQRYAAGVACCDKDHGEEYFSRRLTPFLPSPPPSLTISPQIQPYSTCKTHEFCMTWTTAELENLPVLTIYMDGGVQVNMRPEAYMEASPIKENAYAPR